MLSVDTILWEPLILEESEMRRSIGRDELIPQWDRWTDSNWLWVSVIHERHAQKSGDTRDNETRLEALMGNYNVLESTVGPFIGLFLIARFDRGTLFITHPHVRGTSFSVFIESDVFVIESSPLTAEVETGGHTTVSHPIPSVLPRNRFFRFWNTTSRFWPGQPALIQTESRTS